MDIPNRLPPPEKRKDKISKKHLRIISSLEKTRKKNEKREAFEKEIKAEERNSEHRAKTMAVAKSMRKMTSDLAKIRANKNTVTKKRKLGPEELLFQESLAVFDGDYPVPCVLGPKLLMHGEQHALTEEEIRAQFPDDVVWNEHEYPHIIPHERLWVFCFNCHLGMRSTQVHTCHCCPRYARGDTADCVNSIPIRKWLVTHDDCGSQGTRKI